jgi:hypothetical protein
MTRRLVKWNVDVWPIFKRSTREGDGTNAAPLEEESNTHFWVTDGPRGEVKDHLSFLFSGHKAKKQRMLSWTLWFSISWKITCQQWRQCTATTVPQLRMLLMCHVVVNLSRIVVPDIGEETGKIWRRPS